MKKLSIILCLLITFSFIFPLTVGATENFTPTETVYVYDEAGVLTEEETEDLSVSAAAVAELYECNIYIWIIQLVPKEYDATVADVERYVDAFYYGNDLGFGSEKNGVVLLLETDDVPGERDYLFSVYGNAREAFGSSKRESLLNTFIIPRFKEAFTTKDFYSVADTFIERVDFGFFTYMNPGTNSSTDSSSSYDSDDTSYYTTNHFYLDETFFTKIFICLLVSFIIAWIVVTIWKQRMKSAKIATTALEYIPQGGFKLTNVQDQFLYRTTTTVRISSDDSSSGYSSSDSSSSSSSSSDHSSGGKV